MTPAHRVVINTGILYARMAITVLLSLYTTRVVLDALGVEDFGIFNLVGGVITMLTSLNSSMAAATQRFMSYAQGQGDVGRQHQIFNVSAVLHAGIAVILVGILEVAGVILFDGVLKIAPERMHAAWLVYQFAVASTFFTVIGVPYDAVINARENMLLFAVLGVVEAILKLAIALILVNASTDKLTLYGLLTAIAVVGVLALRVAYCTRRYAECALAPVHYFSRPLFREMTAFAGWSFLGSSTSMLANYGQGLVLNTFFGTRVNSAQGLVGQLSGQLGVLANVMLRAVNPVITKSEGSGDRALMVRATMTASKFSFFFLAVIYVPVMIEMTYLFETWLKVVPKFTIIFCYLLLCRNLIEQLYITLATSISAVGDITQYQAVHSIITLLPLPICYVLFQYGTPPHTLYIVFLIYSVVVFLVTIFYAKKIFGLDVGVFARDVVIRGLTVLALSVIITLVPHLLMEKGLLRLVVVGIVATIAMFVLYWVIGLSSGEQSVARSVMNSARHRITSALPV